MQNNTDAENGAAASAEIFPAATVILVRDAPDGLQVLLLRRNKKVKFAGGLWVFPGGKVEQSDKSGGGGEAAARQAGVRETQEETGLHISADKLSAYSHWTTPPIMPKRFSTWFFLTGVPYNDSAIQVDDSEILQYKWLTPSAALAQRDTGALEMMAPTFVCLTELAECADADAAIAMARAREMPVFDPHFAKWREGPHMGSMVALYEGDVAYESRDLDARGSMHRCEMYEDGWTYLRD